MLVARHNVVGQCKVQQIVFDNGLHDFAQSICERYRPVVADNARVTFLMQRTDYGALPVVW